MNNPMDRIVRYKRAQIESGRQALRVRLVKLQRNARHIKDVNTYVEFFLAQVYTGFEEFCEQVIEDGLPMAVCSGGGFVYLVLAAQLPDDVPTQRRIALTLYNSHRQSLRYFSRKYKYPLTKAIRLLGYDPELVDWERPRLIRVEYDRLFGKVKS